MSKHTCHQCGKEIRGDRGVQFATWWEFCYPACWDAYRRGKDYVRAPHIVERGA